MTLTRRRAEILAMKRALKQAKGNKTQAAMKLCMSVRGLRNRIEKEDELAEWRAPETNVEHEVAEYLAHQFLGKGVPAIECEREAREILRIVGRKR